MDAFTAFIVCFIVTFALIQVALYFLNKRADKHLTELRDRLNKKYEESGAALRAETDRLYREADEKIKAGARANIRESRKSSPEGGEGPTGRTGPIGRPAYKGHVPPRPLPSPRALDPAPVVTSTDWPTPLPSSIHDYSPAPAAPSYHGGGGSFDGGGASGDWGGSSSSSDSGSSYSSSDSGSSSSSDSGSSSSSSD